jgi:ketosteroid isomerase-like protein
MAAVSASGATNTARAQTTLSATFSKLLATEYSATVQGDTATLARQLADDLIWIVGPDGSVITKRQLLAAAARFSKPAPRFEADSVHATRFGDVATVEYLRHDRWPIGDGVFTNSWRALDVFVARAGRWQLERHSQVWLVLPVKPITLDSTALKAFVGRYQIGPGYVDNVHWEGGRLVATASGQTVGAHLVPVSSAAFSPDGDGALIVFERDRSGRVVGYVQGYPDGTVFRAMKLP